MTACKNHNTAVEREAIWWNQAPRMVLKGFHREISNCTHSPFRNANAIQEHCHLQNLIWVSEKPYVKQPASKKMGLLGFEGPSLC